MNNSPYLDRPLIPLAIALPRMRRADHLPRDLKRRRRLSSSGLGAWPAVPGASGSRAETVSERSNGRFSKCAHAYAISSHFMPERIVYQHLRGRSVCNSLRFVPSRSGAFGSKVGSMANPRFSGAIGKGARPAFQGSVTAGLAER
jgi:hypothetical protein